MKPQSSICYGKDIPNLPVLKKNLLAVLSKEELLCATEIAISFLRKTLISKTFLEEAKKSTPVNLTYEFDAKHSDIELRKEITDYAVLMIFGELFINDSCPDALNIILGYDSSTGITYDPSLQGFCKDDQKDTYVITLSTTPIA